MSDSKILFFGKLKGYAPKEGVTLVVNPQMTVKQLRSLVAQRLAEVSSIFPGESELVSSAIANEDRVLKENETVGESREFSFLPPVCGG